MKRLWFATPAALVAVFGCASLLSFAQEEPAQPASLAQRIQAVVQHPLVVETQGYQPVKEKSYRHNLSSESIIHPKGFYRSKNILFHVFQTEPLEIGFYSDSELRLIQPGAKVLSAIECKEIGERFLREAFPHFFARLPLPTVEEHGPTRDGTYSFEWQRYRADELPDTSVRVTVRALDGKIVGFSAGRFVGTWEHKITPSQAKQKAIAQATAKGFRDVRVSTWRLDGGGGRRYYSIGLKAASSQAGQTLETGVSVDAENGKINGSIEGWEVVPDLTKNILQPPTDRLPVWTRRGLIFSSTRSLEGMPVWAPFVEQLFVRDTKGQFFSITSDLMGSKFGGISASPDSDWVALQWHNWSYALNLQDGNYRVLANSKRTLVTPAVQPDGTWAISSGLAATGNAGFDLMPDSLQREPAMALRGRLLMPNSDESTPIFSPDGQWLYFLKSKEDKGSTLLSLHRIPASLIQTKERLAIKDEQQQAIIEKIPFVLERLSITPNGKSLIAQVPVDYVLQQNDAKTSGKMVKVPARIIVIDIETKKLRELKLPVLKDTEIGSISIEDLQDAWAGPGNDEVTFSGKTIDADKKERRRIYSCRFDGSNLRAWTPKENQPVPAYEFPETQKTAYELAKEIALGELEFNDKEKTAR